MSGLIILLVPLLILLVSALIPLASSWRDAPSHHFFLVERGGEAQANILTVGPADKSGRCWVSFCFERSPDAGMLTRRQKTTRAALLRAGMAEGSTVTIRFRKRWPYWAFIPQLVLAENLSMLEPDESPLTGTAASIFFVRIIPPVRGRWFGNADVLVAGDRIQWNCLARRPFWFSLRIQRQFALNEIDNVERVGRRLRLRLPVEAKTPLTLQIEAVNDEEAIRLQALLPVRRGESFTPVLAEQSEFDKALTTVSAKAPVTPALIYVNAMIFLVASAVGAGFMVSDPYVMIRLGTDYTPLTMNGQWWRLLSSIFLHFGLMHLALNMWALYVNGVVAERIFGSARYLMIYLVSGVSGSIASLLWHPMVNGAGASGAIFGVLGALIAFFWKKEGGVPASVVKAQLTSSSIFVLYSIMGGLSAKRIDNAAHLGGLAAGFILGLILSRPLVLEREQRRWTGQWLTAWSLVGGGLFLFCFLAATERLRHREARKSSEPMAPNAAPARVPEPEPVPMPLPPKVVLAGVALGSTPEQVIALKGTPLTRTDETWTYNAIDARHDGLISIYFRARPSEAQERVAAISFVGHDQGSAPTEMPYLNASTDQQVAAMFGPVMNANALPNGGWTSWYPNGVFVRARADKVFEYGIFDLDRFKHH